MKKSPLLAFGVRYGAIAGLLTITLFIATYYIGGHPFMIAPFMDFRVLLYGVFIFFGLREYRVHQEGVLYFWQGMIGSFILVMVAGTIASLLLAIFCSFEPGFISSYVAEMTEYLKGFAAEDIERIGKEVYARNLEQLPSTNGKQLAGLYFMQSVTIGFFVSIILSVILRKQPKQD
jgi:hypothetical protein